MRLRVRWRKYQAGQQNQRLGMAELVVAGYLVYAINPMQVARYRERHSACGARSDAGDAHVLAKVVRLDRGHHRLMAGDTGLAEGIKLLARSHQSLIWNRQRAGLRARSVPREHFPAALAFDDLTAADAVELLGRAPDPQRAAQLSTSRLTAAATRARRRRPGERAADWQAVLRSPALRQPPDLEAAYAAVLSATGQFSRPPLGRSPGPVKGG